MESLKRNLKAGDYIHSAKDKMEYVFTIGNSDVSVYKYYYNEKPWVATVNNTLGKVRAVATEEECRRLEPDDD